MGNLFLAAVKKDVDQKYPMYTRCWPDVERQNTEASGEPIGTSVIYPEYPQMLTGC